MVVVKLGNPKNKKLVFVIDEHGRTLAKRYLHRLISELFDNVLKEKSIDAVVANGQLVNNCVYLADQIAGRSVAEWDIIYLHGSEYPPVLLDYEDKERLITLLPEFKGTSAEAIYKVLTDTDAFKQYN